MGFNHLFGMVSDKKDSDWNSHTDFISLFYSIIFKDNSYFIWIFQRKVYFIIFYCQ